MVNDRRTNEHATQQHERSHSTTQFFRLSLFCLRIWFSLSVYFFFVYLNPVLHTQSVVIQLCAQNKRLCRTKCGNRLGPFETKDLKSKSMRIANSQAKCARFLLIFKFCCLDSILTSFHTRRSRQITFFFCYGFCNWMHVRYA